MPEFSGQSFSVSEFHTLCGYWASIRKEYREGGICLYVVLYPGAPATVHKTIEEARQAALETIKNTINEMPCRKGKTCKTTLN